MAISFLPDSGVFTLETQNTTYQMKISDCGYLLHSYYGEKARGICLTSFTGRTTAFQEIPMTRAGTGPIPWTSSPRNIPGATPGDFRTPCLAVRYPDGSLAADLPMPPTGSSKASRRWRGLPGLPAGKTKGKP